MKGDFSKLSHSPKDNFTGVLHQQGRVLLDQDWNAGNQIARHLRQVLGADVIGRIIVAVPSSDRNSFKVTHATSDGNTVELTLEPGRVWIDGLQLYVPAFKTSPIEAEYFGEPFQDPADNVGNISNGTRDAVVLEVWEDAFNGFQDSPSLIESALGGPDTTERVKLSYALRLLRLNEGDNCNNLESLLNADKGTRGELTATLQPATHITGECPVDAGGGYTGFEHFLYRIEIAEPDASNDARFKWSRFAGGLVGRGAINTAGDEVTITANDQMINQCGLTEFYLEALKESDDGGRWEVTFSAKATLGSDGKLSLSSIAGDQPGNTTWPASAPDNSAFFRLWDGVKFIKNLQTGLPEDQRKLENGIILDFDPPLADNSNYRPQDYWTFPVRAAGVKWTPPPTLVDGPPEGIKYHRAPLAILNWDGPPTITITFDDNEIQDCRHIFQPMADRSECCAFTVGDGVMSHGQFNSIAQALRHLPERGGKICLLPGVHHTNVTIDEKKNIQISGCGLHTVVHPTVNQAQDPIFLIRNSQRIEIDNMTLISATGSAIQVSDQTGASDPSRKIFIHDNRIIACVQAVFVSVLNEIAGNNDIRILNNEIAMLDKAEGKPAIFSQADNVLIERNRIVVIPAPDSDDPGDPRDPDDPDDFYDPCAELFRIYANRNPLFRFLYGVLVYMSSATFTKQISYFAQGGIQIGGGSERVKIIRNRIIGGNGNGITLGHVPEQNPDGSIGIRNERMTYYPTATDDEFNFLRDNMIAFVYEVSIEDNMILNMGLSGVGVPAFFKAEKVALMFSIEDLTIYRNRIERCAHLMPDETAEDMLDEVGFGGIVLAACENAIIQENRLENNGRSQLEPVCGILILYAEKIDVSNNRIINNGPRTFANDDDAERGLRGGIVIMMGFRQMLNKVLDRELLFPDGVPAVKVHNNIVTHPFGQALFIIAFGPVSVIGNHLTSQGADYRVNFFSLIAGAVFILNLGISKDLITAFLLTGFKYMAAANPATFNYAVTRRTAAIDITPGGLVGLIQRILYLPSGNVLFANNQTTLDLRQMDINFAFSAQAIASLDDIAYNSNQSECTSLFDFLYTDVALLGVTIRSNDNRFQEGVTVTLNSLFSFGLMNMATTNQATHCLQVFGVPSFTQNIANTIIYQIGCRDDMIEVGHYLAVQPVEMAVFNP